MPSFVFRGAWLTCVLLTMGTAAAQEKTAEPEMQITAKAVEPDFQPYVFWAYGLACLLLLVFTLWTVAESRKLTARLEVLEERLDKAHPKTS